MELGAIDYLGFQEVFPCGSREEPTSEGLKSFSRSSRRAASQQGSPEALTHSGELVLRDESHTNFSLLLNRRDEEIWNTSQWPLVQFIYNMTQCWRTPGY